ncbi:MAG: hypothetical protein ACREKR_08420 [Candidatus Methylomirabilales bacterium]
MKRMYWHVSLISLLILLGSGCASYDYRYRQSTYDTRVEQGTVLESIQVPAEIEDKILALDPENIDEAGVRGILARGPAPRIINIHGGVYPVYLAMESFAKFLIEMGYPESKIRNPADGSYSYSPYTNAAKIAGIIAWYYEKEGMRVMLVGHSGGGIQTVKVLHELAGTFEEKIPVWNPLTDEGEDRFSIIDPLTGVERPVVGVQVGYATAVGAGGLATLVPTHWNMIGRLRKIPDTAEYFTGFYTILDPIGGTFLGLVKSENTYEANGTAKVRTVTLPLTYNHVAVPFTSHLADNKAIRNWINTYVPSDEPELTVEFDTSSANILWAADVWHSVKKQWCLEAQRLIHAKRNMSVGSGSTGPNVGP